MRYERYWSCEWTMEINRSPSKSSSSARKRPAAVGSLNEGRIKKAKTSEASKTSNPQLRQFERVLEKAPLPLSQYLSLEELANLSQVSKRCEKFVFSAANTYVFELDLSKYDTPKDIEEKLIQIKALIKIKISGMHYAGEFERFSQALNNLGADVEFNAKNCDLSLNGLSKNEFLTIKKSLLLKMPNLKSLNLGENYIGAAGAKVIANSPYLNRLTSLDLARTRIDVGAMAIAKSEHLQTSHRLIFMIVTSEMRVQRRLQIHNI